MRKLVQVIFFILFHGAFAQHTVIRPYSYSNLVNLSDQAFLVCGSDKENSYLEVLNKSGNVKAQFSIQRNKLNWLNNIYYSHDRIYWIYSSDGIITSLMIFDKELNLITNTRLDSNYLFNTNHTASGSILHEGSIYITQKKITGDTFYLNKYSTGGKLVASYPLNAECFFFERQSFLVLSANRFLLLNNCTGGYNYYLDTLGNLKRSYMIPPLAYNRTVRFQDNSIYVSMPMPTVKGSYCFQKYDTNETPLQRVCVDIPDSMECYHSGWSNSEDQLVTAGRDKLYYLDEVSYKVVYTGIEGLYEPVYSMVLYEVDFFKREAHLFTIRKRNYFQPGFLIVDGKYILFYCRGNKEGPDKIYAYTHIELPGSPARCDVKNFPNPAVSQFTVSSDCLLDQKVVTVVLTDQLGRKVMEDNVPVNENGQCTISCNIPEGLYNCRITSGDRVINSKQVMAGR